MFKLHVGSQMLTFIVCEIIFSQAKTINLYKYTRSKLLKCCANIYFNRKCLVKKSDLQIRQPEIQE
jgi:hypothetical protein